MFISFLFCIFLWILYLFYSHFLVFPSYLLSEINIINDLLRTYWRTSLLLICTICWLSNGSICIRGGVVSLCNHCCECSSERGRQTITSLQSPYSCVSDSLSFLWIVTVSVFSSFQNIILLSTYRIVCLVCYSASATARRSILCVCTLWILYKTDWTYGSCLQAAVRTSVSLKAERSSTL